jgi:hypothetical protein
MYLEKFRYIQIVIDKKDKRHKAEIGVSIREAAQKFQGFFLVSKNFTVFAVANTDNAFMDGAATLLRRAL